MEGAMPYRLIDHTADLGMQVSGDDLPDLFAGAALALTDILAGTPDPEAGETTTVTVAGSDWPDLMVNWLREVLYLWSGRARLVGAVRILSLTEYALAARLRVTLYDPAVHVIRQEIKAVTYHQIEVRQQARGWTARVIFDV